MSSSDSDSSSDNDIYETLQANIRLVHQQIEDLSREAEQLEEELQSFHPPIQDLLLSQLGMMPFLEKSPFREASFAVKSPGFGNIDLSKRYQFKQIAHMLRTYLFSINAIRPDGRVQLNTQLQTLFELQGVSTYGYVELLGKLRNVLV